MFDFVDELKELKNIVTDYRYTNYGGKLVVVQGYKDILFYDENNITLKLKKGEISVLGTNLKIKDYTSNFVSIVGLISAVETAGAE